MDFEHAKKVIANQLSSLPSTLTSLQLQNHIYGCFVLIEDIADKTTDITDSTITYSDETSFDFEQQFTNIGTLYGFISDDKLTFTDFSPEYKSFWLDCFQTIDLCDDEQLVDQVEDALFSILKTSIPTDIAFFTNALENSGQLSEEWNIKANTILNPPIIHAVAVSSDVADTEVDAAPITATNVDKPTKKYSKTRRRQTPVKKRNVYNKTRKHNK